MKIKKIIKEEIDRLFEVNQNDFEKEKEIARKTSRTVRYDPNVKTGRGLSESIVPSFAISIASKNDKILDFGAGKHPFYVMKYRDMGYDIYGWDLPETMKFWEENYDEEITPEQGLNKQFDLVYASNVLNVSPSETFLKKLTLNQIIKALKSNGIFVGNYPTSPRKNPNMKLRDLNEILGEYFIDVQYYKDKKTFVAKGLN